MEKEEYLVKYISIQDLISSKQVKLEEYIENWLNGKINVSSDSVQENIDKVNEQIDLLKKTAKDYFEKYLEISKVEMEKEAGLKSAKIGVLSNLGFIPTSLKITGGVASNDAKGTHLLAEDKSVEELVLEKENALLEIRDKVANKELTLAQASNLKNQLNLLYDNLLEQGNYKK